MPKKFTDQEREWINHKLLTEGRRCFEIHGIKKTSVEELTRAAGIAQGSFYMFYGSKEELFYQILLEEEQRIRSIMFDSFSVGVPVTKEEIKLFLLQSFRMMEESPLVRQMFIKSEMEQILRKLPKKLLEQSFSEDKDYLVPFIRSWQSEGILADVDPELIVCMFRSLVLIVLHKDDIGEEQYPATIELLVEVVAEGMTSLKNTKMGGE